jgi:hypothetical protein
MPDPALSETRRPIGGCPIGSSPWSAPGRWPGAVPAPRPQKREGVGPRSCWPPLRPRNRLAGIARNLSPAGLLSRWVASSLPVGIAAWRGWLQLLKSRKRRLAALFVPPIARLATARGAGHHLVGSTPWPPENLRRRPGAISFLPQRPLVAPHCCRRLPDLGGTALGTDVSRHVAELAIPIVNVAWTKGSDKRPSSVAPSFGRVFVRSAVGLSNSRFHESFCTRYMNRRNHCCTGLGKLQTKGRRAAGLS